MECVEACTASAMPNGDISLICMHALWLLTLYKNASCCWDSRSYCPLIQTSLLYDVYIRHSRGLLLKKFGHLGDGEFEASGSVYGVESCKIVFHRRALPIHLFRHFIATMHSIADSRTDRQRYDPNSRLCCVQYDRLKCNVCSWRTTVLFCYVESMNRIVILRLWHLPRAIVQVRC